MSGTFGGLSTALTALYAQRRGLEVAGQNIANVNTEGYSRQRIGLAAVGAPVRPALFAVGDPASGGVEVTDVARVRDEFLEARAREEHGSSAYLGNQREVYSKIEQVIREPSDTGLQSQFSEFWNAWQSLANRPGDLASRTELLQRSSILTDSVRSAYDGIASLWESTREQFEVFVTEVNTTAQSVAKLNEAVVRTRQAGVPGNELADERDAAVLRLSQLTGSGSLLKEDGSVDVVVNGSSLVNGSHARPLGVYGAARLPDQAANPVGIRWTDNGAGASFTSGSVASALGTLNSTLPGIAGALDGVAASLATAVNTQHRAGFDLTGTAGGDLFTGTTAAALTMAVTDPDLLAAASSAPVPPATSTLDGGNALAIADIATSPTGPDLGYRQVVVNLGVAAQSVNRRADIQSAITEDADAARIAHSGVNLDEEMTNMITYQRAYEAAAKVMSVIDATLDSLINSLRR
ncbi:MAG: flagellar hook-associated protein FlgK [Dactylosporangium sp.]|nr:flagellar hook-associated protein FlgK [Dactylosporangium sp.]NNJ61678.1 flagellar hook-associated protein FlgK [Dactylosporangium sp.]